MSGHRGRKVQNLEKPIPLWLGRMVNLFDTGVGENKLLMASSLSRSQSDVAWMSNPPFGDQIEDKVIVSELRRSASNRVNGTPIKKLIAQEMSKEVDSKLSPTNVVAKLMGLDGLPQSHSNKIAHRSKSKGYSRPSLIHKANAVQYWEQDYEDHVEYEDVYEIWKQPEKSICPKDCSPRRGKSDENITDKKMDLVHQKFLEAKRLVTDEKLRESKEFQDAMEILSSNKDLFLKFLQESNSLFSQHLYDFQSIPLPSETKRITILKPSKMAADGNFAGHGFRSDKQTKKAAPIVQETDYSPPSVNQTVEEYPKQPTRIVILKPSPGNAHSIKALASSSPSPQRALHGGDDYFDEPDDVEARESRDVAREVTRQMRENLMGLLREETLLSSIFSNGYIGDDSSFHKSENDYAVENLSDSEIMTPASRHSLDYVNRFGSPYSSCFSRPSCSPDSSVFREAKKRLSERWALMASNGNFQEQKHTQKSSSTLGEMLALSDVEIPLRSKEQSDDKEQEPRASTSCLTTNFNKGEGTSDSPKGLRRSKSVPVSSTLYGTSLNGEIADPEDAKYKVPKEMKKSKSMKLSLKGKVSSFFFSRNKKSSKEKSNASQYVDESQLATSEMSGAPVILPAQVSDYSSQSVSDDIPEEGLLRSTVQKQNIIFREARLSVAQPMVLRNASENQDQPSPISVLETLFEEDGKTVPDSSGLTRPVSMVSEASPKSNLIDKSPPIGSIARIFSRHGSSCTDTENRYSLKPSMHFPETEEEEDWHFLVNKLLSASGLEGKSQSNNHLNRWHSPESPLDPSLRNKFANTNDKETIHDAKRRRHRSKRKLVFDLVNASLLEITMGYHHGSDKNTVVLSCDENMWVDYVWGRMNGWLMSGSESCDDDGDKNSLVVERVVRFEVAGKGWGENMRLEMENIGKEIEGKLVEELVEEAVTDLI